MSLKEKWAAKKKLATDTFEYQGEEVKIREMSGLEKVEFEGEEDLAETSWMIWDSCVLSESLTLTKEEFMHAFDKCHAEVDYIIGKIVTLSNGKKLKN